MVGLIGDPVDHSLSPVIHNAAFAALELDMAYVALPVAAADVADAVRGLRALGFRGANVTMPHKAAVMALLDRVADEAAEVAAVNTIVVADDGLQGHNTDVAGFARALRDVVPGGVAGASVLLVGAGGAGRAAASALAREGVAHIAVADKTSADAAPVVALLDRMGGQVEAESMALGDVSVALVAGSDLIVNATPLGMAGGGKVPRVLVDNISGRHIVYDVVYGKRPTELLERARVVEARVVDGLSMLVWQAASAFELWTGRTAPVEVMRSAAR